MSTTSHEQRAPVRQLWGHLGHVRSGGTSQSEGAASVAGTGSSAGPAWVLNVTQHRTTPHESLHCFLVTLSFLFQVPPGSTDPAGPPASNASSASRACQPSSAGTVTPQHVPGCCRCQAASQGPKSPAFSGQWSETQWVQTQHGRWPSVHTRAKWGKRGALCPVGNEPGWGS